MHRTVFFALAILFAAQSTGATALRGSTQDVGQSSFFAQLRMDFAPILASAAATHIGALLTMNADRWNAMHAPPPARVTAVKSDPSKTIQHGVVRPTFAGIGMRGAPPEMLKQPLLPKDADKLQAPSITASGATRASASLIHAPTIDDLLTRVQLPAHTPTPRSSRIRPMDVTVSSANTTGINPWWTYEEAAIPGVGKYMVNVANGNLIVQSDDIDVPERGIDLAFRRTYNSMSLRNWNANGQSDDGSPTPGTYGSGWTNTFDAHIAGNTAGGISVFDIDGARYDYSSSGSGCLNPPPGMYNTLCTDGGSGWLWTKKNGTVYYFFGPSLSGSSAAYAGRLQKIFGRNHNNYVAFTYYWTGGDSSTTANLTQIVAQHSDGHSLTLAFGTVNGKVLLSSVTRPDNQQATYWYYNYPSTTEAEVDLPGNNQGTLRQQYGYLGTSTYLTWVCSPRWLASGQAEGSYIWFGYDVNHKLSSAELHGTANFVPNDGTGTAIQPIATGWQTIAETFFWYGSSTQTNLTDIDGHATNWVFDSAGRVTQTQQWTGTNSLWLVTTASWDSSNNLTQTVDARGYATDYAYDTNGNTIAVALPSVSTNQGTFRPTSLYSYDRTNGANNVAEYCDPVKSHSLGADWTSNPGTSDSLCPNQSGATRYTWDYSDATVEPFGRLSNSYTPLGYHQSYAYDVAGQAGVDAGLPTSVTGDGFSQLDNTFVTPQQTFTYDARGNVLTYNTGNGTWAVAYDSLNRRTSATDPDNVTSRTCYFANGSVQATQSAAQYALDGGLCGTHSISYMYDPDGDEISETHHYSGGNDVTSKWYDGEDRLVEVKPPTSDRTKWARYKYDLSQGGTVSVDGSGTFKAYGNLFATEVVNGSTWQDSRGQSFDALDRNKVIYRYKPTGGVYQTTSAYDANSSSYGLLASSTDGLSQTTSYTYDADGHATNISFQNDGGVTPARAYTFDADGRPTLISSSNGSRSYAYDSSGRLTSTTQTNTGFSGTTFSYDYYANGWRSDLNVSGPYVSQTQLLKYSYRADGQRKTESFAYAGNTWQFSWGLTAGGRETSFVDPYFTRQKTYDSYGRLASDTLAQGAYTSLTYNPEDGVTGYAAFGGQSATLSYDSVNQLTAEAFAPGGEFWPNGPAGGACTSGTMNCDTLNGAVISQNDSGEDWTRSKNWNYDNAGRQNVQTGTYDWSGPCNNPLHPTEDTCYADAAGTKATAFDAENHLIGTAQATTNIGGTGPALGNCPPPSGHGTSVNQNQVNPPAAPTVTPSDFYGPDGHLIKDNGEQIYWDGDQPLFTVTSAGALDDIKVDGFAVYSAQQTRFAVLDRDFSGTQISQHNSTGNDSWGPQDPYHTGCSTVPEVGGTSGYARVTERISQPGTDGIYDGTNTFQGARAYDPVAQQWTAPDAYAGDVHDPMSQRSYMWNRNNPLQYQDPSGYCSGGPDCALESAMSTTCIVVPHCRSVVDGAYNFLIGDDISTLKSPKASTLAKVFAGISIAANLFPAGRGLEIGGKLFAFGTGFVEKATTREVTSGMIRDAVLNGAQHTDSVHPGTIVHVLQGGGPRGNNLTVITNARTNTLINAIPHKKAFHADASRFTRIPGTP